MDLAVALGHQAEDSDHQDLFHLSQEDGVLDPEAHLQDGILVGDLRWEDQEDPGGQDLDQWVQVDLVGLETGDLLMEDLGVQEVGIRAERVVSRDTRRRS